jgi:Zn-dependent M28 family amino/carboxypeptidase
MFQKLILFLIFSYSHQLHARAPGSYAALKSDLQKVSAKNITDWVNGLVRAGAPSRMVGLPGHDKAKNFIQDAILKIDTKNSGKMIITSTPPDIEVIKDFYKKDFDQKITGKISPTHPDYQKWFKFTSSMQIIAESKKSFPVQNIIWEKVGLNSNKVLVITAHYDTISHDKKTFLINENASMPGANYNASGVAVALGLIKTLSQIDLNYSVCVVFLDWQGIGFYGSHVYAKELKNSSKDILGVVNLEMLGQDTSYFDKTKKNGNMSVYLRNLADEQRWVQRMTDIGQVMTKKVSFEIKPIGFENSDNFRFWEQGFKSATFSQNWEDDFNPKFFQTPEDTPETLNHEILWHSFQYIGGAVAGILLDLMK